MKKLVRLNSQALVVVLTLQSTALAAPPSTSQRPYINGQRPASADLEYKFEKLAVPVQLPNLPSYPGRATFIRGLRYPNARAGARVGLVYGVLEEPNQILEWYRETLKNYQWKVSTDPTPNKIFASQSGNVVTISVGPSTKRTYRSELDISYTFVR